jgi:hypothetical protein
VLDAATVPLVLILLPDSVTPPTVVLLILVTPVMLPPMFKVVPFHVNPLFAFKCAVSAAVVVI